MTCAEFWQLMDKNPDDCTRAERLAHFKHSEECQTCSDKLFTESEAAQQQIKDTKHPIEAAVLDAILRSEAHDLAESDKQDPEFLEELRRIYTKEKGTLP